MWIKGMHNIFIPLPVKVRNHHSERPKHCLPRFPSNILLTCKWAVLNSSEKNKPWHQRKLLHTAPCALYRNLLWMRYIGHGKVDADRHLEKYRKKICTTSVSTEYRSKPIWSLQHLQHGRFAAASGPENKFNIPIQAIVDNRFNKLCFIHKIGA